MGKKIMQINITCGRGSTGKLALALYKTTKKAGFTARFAYSVNNPVLQEAFPIESKWQNYLRRGLNRYFGIKQKHSNPGTKRLIRYIKREKPDLIHLHNIQQNSVNYHMLLAFLKESKIPIVYTLHDCWAFTGGCYYFTAAECDHYQCGCVSCPQNTLFDDNTINPEKAYISKKILIGGNDKIYPVCVSNWLRNAALNSYMGKMHNLPQTIYNGISTEQFYPRTDKTRTKLGISSEGFVILGVASCWDERKNLPLFFRLAERFSTDAKIVLVGVQKEKCFSLPENVICFPKIENQDQLASFYSMADVYVNASIEETFGLTTVEAMACGTPAVVFNSTACPELISDDTGKVIPCDFEEVCKAIDEIKNKGKAFYSGSCVRRVKLLFDEKIMTQAYLRLYRGILNDK